MHPHRHARAGLARQGGFPVDPGRSTPSITLGHLPHTDQRVRPGTQHQFLQRPDLRPVLLPRRLENPAPQPRYVLLMGTPINDAPIHNNGNVLGSVHRDGVQLAPTVREAPGLGVQRLTCPRQHPHGPNHVRVGIRPVLPRRSTEAPTMTPRVSCRLSATGIRLLGFLPGPRRGFHVPHIRVPTGLGALYTPRPRGAPTTDTKPIGCRAPPLPRARSYRPGPLPTVRTFRSRGVIEGSLTFARPVFSLAW